MIKAPAEGGLGLADPHPNGFRPLDALEAVSLVVASGNVAALHELINPKEEGGLNLPMHIGIFKAEDHLFTAAKHGRIAMLRELVRPDSEGGKFGLSINTKDHNGGDLVLSAVMGDQVEMLRELIKPVAEGGFGLSLNTRDIVGFTPVSLAVRLGKIRILNELIKPVSQGGFGQSFNVEKALLNNSDDLEVLKFIFRYQLRQLGSGNFWNALSWLKEYRQLINQHKELKEMCLAFMKSVLCHLYARENVNYTEVNLIKEEINKYTGNPDEADFVIARFLAEQGDFIRSFLQYESIVKRNNSPSKYEAEFEMADLIYRGEIILFENHSINFAASGARQQPTTLDQAKELEQLREKESKNLPVMNQRARHVYELLLGNPLPQAAFLRARCEEIFQGNLSPTLSENNSKKRNQDVLQPNEREHQIGFFKKPRNEPKESPSTNKTLEM
ncbi:ankyrin repeat domain-containing protein [Legionella genomosp. 1]|uniref:ankyrin repeat domain-containing protein n=1 Tax=Legionella genomosp. 1 TaxID=1093625 RepID=UPI0010556A86|nr:ankyrin repeat domain-containing protein [Legionella genomosp. 1]